MTVVQVGTKNLNNNVQQLLFDADDLGLIPSIIGGHIDATSLLDPDDIIEIQLRVRYTEGGSFFDAGVLTFKKADEICWFTPVEFSFGYKILITLVAGSPSTTADLPFLIQATAVE